MRESLGFLYFQMKNNRKVVIGYVVIYIILMVQLICLRIGTDNADMLYDKYSACLGTINICSCILSPFPILFFTTEITESEKYPYIKLYKFRWGWRDNVICHIVSLICPFILFLLLNCLYQDVIYADDIIMRPGVLWFCTMEYLVVIFVLSSFAFLLTRLAKNVMMSLVIVMSYTIIMLFMDFLPDWVNVTAVVQTLAWDWMFLALRWLIIGLLLNGTGLLILKRGMES